MKKKKVEVEKPVVVPIRVPMVEMPKKFRNCSTCSWVRNGRCPFFGELKDGGDLKIEDNGCTRHNFAVIGDEW